MTAPLLHPEQTWRTLHVPTRRSIYGLDGANFFVAAMQAGFGMFVTVHLVQNQWAVQDIGFALTISTICSLVSQVPAGAFIDHLRDKRFAAQLGTIGVGLAALLLALTPARPAVYLAQALQGLASSLIAPGIAAITLVSVGQTEFSHRVGRNARFASLGAGITAGVMGLAASYFEPVSIFWLTAALTVPALLSLSLVESQRAKTSGTAPSPGEEPRPEDTRITWESVKRLFTDHRLLIFALCIVLFFASSAALPQGVAVRATRNYPDIATIIVAATILLPQGIVALISPWVGRTAERVGRRPMLLLGWGLLPVQGVLYATVPGPYALVTYQLLSGVSGAAFGVMMTVVANDLTRGTSRFNLALGTLGVAISAGASLSTFFAGIIAGAFGGTVTYFALALVGLCGVLLLWFGMPETSPSLAVAPEREGHYRFFSTRMRGRPDADRRARS
jgi:MFS family permease